MQYVSLFIIENIDIKPRLTFFCSEGVLIMLGRLTCREIQLIEVLILYVGARQPVPRQESQHHI